MTSPIISSPHPDEDDDLASVADIESFAEELAKETGSSSSSRARRGPVAPPETGSEPAAPVKITENRREVLESLEYEHRKGRDADGVAPLDFGGSNGSHHGNTATDLARLGLVDRRYRGYTWGEPKKYRNRGSCLYRINTAGLEALARALGREAASPSEAHDEGPGKPNPDESAA